MTAEEVFCDLYDKYGKALTWHMIPLSQSNGALVEKLKKEIGNNHFLYNRKIWAVAKCERNGDVLYVSGSGNGKDIYYIFSLTYSADNNLEEFPEYKEFKDIREVKEFIEQSLNENLCRDISNLEGALHMDYPFYDAPNTAAIVCCHIIDDGKPVLYVSHDEDDGMWQFLCGSTHETDEARLVSLRSVFDLDPSVGDLKDMPCGYYAERKTKNDNWIVKKR